MRVRWPKNWWQDGWFDPAMATRDLEACRVDVAGQKVHLYAAMFLCFFLPWMTSATEIAGAPLAVWTAIRLRRNVRAARWAAALPLGVLVLAFCCWQWLTLLWTPDVHEGVKQAGATRWIWFAPMMFPVLEHRGKLIGALMLGFLAGNCSQLLHALGAHFHVAAITWNRLPHRDSGWWDPVVGGSLLTAALGLYLPAISFARSTRARLLGSAGAIVTLAGIFATGTRGAWLASIALISVWLVTWAFRGAKRSGAAATPRPRRSPMALLGNLGLIVVVLVLGAKLGPTVRARVQQGWQDVSGAIERKDFTSDTGARLLMAWWAIEAFEEHPVRGIGVGGFRAWSVEHLKAQGIDPSARSTHAHAHNALLHVAATTGAIGLALALAIVFLALRNAWQTGAVLLDRSEAFPSSLAPFFALLGLLLVSAFDSIHVNAQTSALAFLLIALSPGIRPDEGTDPSVK